MRRRLVQGKQGMFKQFLAAAVLLFAGTVNAEEAAERYVNPTLGFSVAKPAGWVYLSAQQNLENLKRARMSSDEFQKQMVQQASAPLVVMAQHLEPFDGLNASFKANIKPFGALPTRDPQKLLQMLLPTLQQQMPDSRVIVPVHTVTVGGRPAAHVAIEYTLRNAEGGEFATASELWIVPVGDYFYMLGAGYAQGDAATKAQIEAVVGSVDLAE